jgi:polynucleotide 5'-hydroxyl-kinase GRC3/NOL9
VSKELTRLNLEHWLPPIQKLLRREGNAIPKLLVSGAKGTGKSTFCRVLINHMLTMEVNGNTGKMKAFPNGVIFLDIDPGQPELAAPSVIYVAHVRAPLLGPAFANMIIPGLTDNVMLRMHYLGSHTPRECPSHYQSCVADLYSLCCNYGNVPLVVNTCGWIAGSGKSVLLSAMQGMKLTDLVHLGDSRNTALQDIMESTAGGDDKVLMQIQPHRKRSALRSARDFREMQLLAYLHASSVVHGRVLHDLLPITTLRDCLPTKSGDSTCLSTIVLLDEDVSPEYLIEAVNGAVTAIVAIKHDSHLYEVMNGNMRSSFDAGMHIICSQSSQVAHLVCGGKAANPLDPQATECIGLGYIAVAELQGRQLRVRSPVSAAQIAAEIAKGHKIALVVAQQQGLWASLERNVACKERIEQLNSQKGIGKSAGTKRQADGGWEGLFGEVGVSRRPKH